jgi:hypothetical protein
VEVPTILDRPKRVAPSIEVAPTADGAVTYVFGRCSLRVISRERVRDRGPTCDRGRVRAGIAVVLLVSRTAGAEPARDRAWALTKDAEAAARAGDCARVATLAGKVRALDGEFYVTVTARDAAVSRCLALDPPVESAPDPAPPPASPPTPTADDPIGKCRRVRHEMSEHAATIANIDERGRFLQSMPDCTTRFGIDDPIPVPTSPTAPAPSLCLEGARYPECAAIVVGEFGWRAGNIETLTLDAGLLINSHGNNAVGATIGLLGYKREDASGGWTSAKFVELRYRRWLTDDEALDLGAVGLQASDGRNGAMVVSALEFRDAVALTASVEMVPLGASEVVGASVGFRLGAKPIGYTVGAIVYVFSVLSDVTSRAGH